MPLRNLRFVVAVTLSAALLSAFALICCLPGSKPRYDPPIETLGQSDQAAAKHTPTAKVTADRPRKSQRKSPSKPAPKTATLSARSRADADALKGVSPAYTIVGVYSNMEQQPAVTRAQMANSLWGTRIEELPIGGGPSSIIQLPDQTASAKSSPKKNTRYRGTADSAFAAHQMVDVEATGDRTAVLWIHSRDARTAWRVSSGRYVEMSSDAGVTWRTQWTSPTAYVTAGSSPSSNICWLVGKAGVVLVSTDRLKWHAIEPPSNADFLDVIASDALTATITTVDGREYQTIDGGKHWVLAP